MRRHNIKTRKPKKRNPSSSSSDVGSSRVSPFVVRLVVRAIAICQISGTLRPANAAGRLAGFLFVCNLVLNLLFASRPSLHCLLEKKKENFPLVLLQLLLLLLPMVPLSLSEGGGGEID